MSDTKPVIEFDTYAEAFDWINRAYGEDITVASINKKELKVSWHDGIAEDGTNIWRDESFNTEDELDAWVAYYKNDKEMKVLPPKELEELERLWKASVEYWFNDEETGNTK